MFKDNRNIFLIPTNQTMVLNFYDRREIYDDNRYIYKFKGDDPRCRYGYLTNKDDKPESFRLGYIVGKRILQRKTSLGFVFLIYLSVLAITDHLLTSLSRLNLAFAGLVDGSFITSFFVAFMISFSKYFLQIS